jgi:D-xylulose reductase
MEALVLEKAMELTIRDIDIQEKFGPDDVRIAINYVGICGSDVHFYQYGAIGNFIVRSPMVLGHEASGEIIEAGENVKNLKPGDRVCMEPGIPDQNSKAVKLGIYNLDPAIRFWSAPPVHGCLRPYLIHPASFTYKLPDNVSSEEGALVEPLAVGMNAVKKAKIKPGDIAVVIGAGTIGLMTTIAALAGGCSRVIIADVIQNKLDFAEKLGSVVAVNVQNEDLHEIVKEQTDSWGSDIVFEASGNERAIPQVFDLLCPDGCVVFIGCPTVPVSIDITAAQVKEARIETIFRYANVFPRALALMGAGKINLKSLITESFDFKEGIKAFEHAAKMNPGSIKTQIVLKDI